MGVGNTAVVLIGQVRNGGPEVDDKMQKDQTNHFFLNQQWMK